MKKSLLLLTMTLSLLIVFGCGNDEKEVLVDDPAYSVRGQWYAEVAMEGETPDMLSEDGELAPYDRVVVLLNALDDTYTSVVLFLYGEELIRYDYGDYLSGENVYTIDKEGNIMLQSLPALKRQYRSARYEKGVINANLTIPEGDLTLLFRHPTPEQMYWISLWTETITNGFGYSDSDKNQSTDVSDNSATGPAQAPRR